MYHIFFIHSSVNGHLGCFHVLAIVNTAAMNIGVHVSFQTMFFSGYMPRTLCSYWRKMPSFTPGFHEERVFPQHNFGLFLSPPPLSLGGWSNFSDEYIWVE